MCFSAILTYLCPKFRKVGFTELPEGRIRRFWREFLLCRVLHWYMMEQWQYFDNMHIFESTMQLYIILRNQKGLKYSLHPASCFTTVRCNSISNTTNAIQCSQRCWEGKESQEYPIGGRQLHRYSRPARDHSCLRSARTNGRALACLAAIFFFFLHFITYTASQTQSGASLTISECYPYSG